MDHLDGAGGTNDEEDTAARRAELVREFLGRDDRTAALADEYASRLGMSRSGFYRLTQAFDDTRDKLRKRADTNASRLDETVEQQISLVLDQLRADGRAAEAYALIKGACKKLGLRAPGRDVVRRRMIERLSVATPTLAGPTLQIDETGIGVAVRADGGTLVVPSMCLLIHAPTRRVLAHRLDTTAGGGGPQALLKAVGLSLDAVRGRPRLKGGAAAALFGTRLGPFLLRPRAAGSVAAKHYTFRVGIEEARQVVGRLVDEHNAGRPQI